MLLPVERHPANNDQWGMTVMSIGLMSLVIFVLLGILVHRSFRLVPTGMLALHTIVPADESHHQLPPDHHDCRLELLTDTGTGTGTDTDEEPDDMPMPPNNNL